MITYVYKVGQKGCGLVSFYWSEPMENLERFLSFELPQHHRTVEGHQRLDWNYGFEMKCVENVAWSVTDNLLVIVQSRGGPVTPAPKLAILIW